MGSPRIQRNAESLRKRIAELEAERDELRKDRERLEFAMAKLFIVRDVGPNTTRIWDTRGALDETMRAEEGGKGRSPGSVD